MSRFMIAALVALSSSAPAAVPTTVKIRIDGTGVSSREIQLSGTVRADSSGLAVSLNLVNVLAQPVVPRATLRFDRATIDSAFTAQGRAFARALAANANRRR